ncbi:hypothetical protein A0H81_07193 [Grifola frondosa]|uniref:Uncharacterized protein n=1 Tax=Grifola frondosa TaxID=5627 RepID=A0A1C7M8V1_GRIFR|nr:hypothetical protein A0H81_07193 [Grifola frondosa]
MGPSVSPFGSAVPKPFFGGTSTVPTPPSLGSAAISPAPTSFGSPPNGSAAPPTSFGLSSAEPTTAPPFGVSSSAGSSTLTPSFTSPPSFNLSTVSTPLGVSSVNTAPQSPSPFNQLPPPAASTSMNGAAIPSESPFRLTAPPPASPFLNPFAPTFQPTSFTPSAAYLYLQPVFHLFW